MPRGSGTRRKKTRRAPRREGQSRIEGGAANPRLSATSEFTRTTYVLICSRNIQKLNVIDILDPPKGRNLHGSLRDDAQDPGSVPLSAPVLSRMDESATTARDQLPTGGETNPPCADREPAAAV